MTPKQMRGVLVLGLLATLGLTWFAPQDDDAAISTPVKSGPLASVTYRRALDPARAPEISKHNAEVELAFQEKRPKLSEASADGVFDKQTWFRPPPPPPPPPPAPPPPPPPPPAPPPLPFTYLGKYIEESKSVMILARGSRVITASQGDVLDSVYRLEKIEPSSIQLMYLPLGIPQILSTGSSQ